MVGLAGPAFAGAGIDAELRPGDALGFPAFCTLAFFLLGPGGEVYATTAGHCVLDRVGGLVGNAEFPAFGTVVEAWDESGTFDFGLIRLAQGIPWDAEVRAIGGPTGYVADPADTSTGLELATYGHAFPDPMVTREKRGLLLTDDASSFTWVAPTAPGDSGAPVVVVGSGLAMGIVADGAAFKGRIGTDVGPTVAEILDRMGTAGYSVVLATAQP